MTRTERRAILHAIRVGSLPPMFGGPQDFDTPALVVRQRQFIEVSREFFRLNDAIERRG